MLSTTQPTDPCASDLARMEHKRFYATNQTAIASLELVTAMANVLIARFGQEFADDMRKELQARAATLNGADFEKACTATIVTQMAEWAIWKPRH